ncbi:MAG: hypothetical protein GYB65_05255 [Chloroflexi bacterium]|nr:hypothetical protein [Chloroflexota bacterium]
MDTWQPAEFYTQVIFTTREHVPLLANGQLVRLVVGAVNDCVPDAPGEVWAYLVLPDALRVIFGPTGEKALDTYVESVKAHTQAHLLAAILRADDDTLDPVLRYNPVWGGAIYHVWQAGYHRQDYHTTYRLSNAIFELQQLPVEAGLVSQPAAWPYLWIGNQDAG